MTANVTEFLPCFLPRNSHVRMHPQGTNKAQGKPCAVLVWYSRTHIAMETARGSLAWRLWNGSVSNDQDVPSSTFSEENGMGQTPTLRLVSGGYHNLNITWGHTQPQCEHSFRCWRIRKWDQWDGALLSKVLVGVRFCSRRKIFRTSIAANAF